eukprot:COSAG02_NODE_1665_length_11425_cov_4.620872_4_plen_259_part_00
MEVDAQAVGLTESFSSWQFDGRSARGSTSSCSSKGSSGWTSDALGMPDFRCTSWAQSVESLARSMRSSCSSSDSLSSTSSGVSAGAKKAKLPKASPKKATQKKALGAGGWRPMFGDVLEASSAIPEGVPPAGRSGADPSHPESASPSAAAAAAASSVPVSGGLRLEGYLKKKNPHGITWYATMLQLVAVGDNTKIGSVLVRAGTSAAGQYLTRRLARCLSSRNVGSHKWGSPCGQSMCEGTSFVMISLAGAGASSSPI